MKKILINKQGVSLTATVISMVILSMLIISATNLNIEHSKNLTKIQNRMGAMNVAHNKFQIYSATNINLVESENRTLSTNNKFEYDTQVSGDNSSKNINVNVYLGNGEEPIYSMTGVKKAWDMDNYYTKAEFDSMYNSFKASMPEIPNAPTIKTYIEPAKSQSDVKQYVNY